MAIDLQTIEKIQQSIGAISMVSHERAVLATILSETDLIYEVQLQLEPQDFSNHINKNIYNIMLEIATRFNDPTLASQSIPLLNVDNLPNTLAKSNWYISQQEYSNAIKILTPYRIHGGALYRIILSKQKLNDPLAEKDLNELTQRVQNLLDHKDHIHLREQAQFLWVSKNMMRVYA